MTWGLTERKLGYGSIGSTWVDLSQYINKSGYYDGFKTQFRSRPNARFRSFV